MSQPVVVDVAAGNSRILRRGAIGCHALALLFLLPAVVGAVQGELGFAIGLGATGLAILAIGLLPVLAKNLFLRPRRLVADQTGLRWEDPKGRPWAVRWDELGAVVVSVTGQLVRVDLHPAGPQVRAQHPELEHLWETEAVRNGYAVPLGPNPELIGRLDHALRTFDRTGIYRGVVSDVP